MRRQQSSALHKAIVRPEIGLWFPPSGFDQAGTVNLHRAIFHVGS
jgi:hypothetical protein